VALLEKIVKMRETTLAEDDPDRLGLQRPLGRAYWVNGQVKEAVELLEHVVEIREPTLVKDHPDLLDTYACLYLLCEWADNKGCRPARAGC
jgi:hypothetical protein